jgi:hypothetical protein
MILKGNIRAGGQELATHLLNDRHEMTADDHGYSRRIGNEKVELAEIRGFATEDLHGALAEVEAIATGTNSTKPLYSLSINPNQEMTREQYGQAIDKIERKLGLDDQARAVVFHVKNGREHCHVVWSRIDTEKMQARHMEFDRQKLREVARELVRDFGHEMPKHLGEDRGTDRHKDKFNQATLAEKGQAERSGISPEKRREAVTEAYQIADNAGAFRHALEDAGYILAEGDRRGFVVVDVAGEVHSLTRQIEGATAKEIRNKLDLNSVENLPTVQKAKEQIASLTRQQAVKATQERPDSAKRVEIAQDALTALAEAQRAELKAMKGHKADQLGALRAEQTERINFTRSAIKQAYRPDWTGLFKKQRDEMKEITKLKKSPLWRLNYILKHKNMDKFDKGASGHLSKAFNWLRRVPPKDRISSLREQIFSQDSKASVLKMFKFVMKGEFDYKKLEKTHLREKQELGDLQKLAERMEIQAIKQEVTSRRENAHADHKATLADVKADHADELTKAVKALETARKMTERDGTDLSRGEVARREKPRGFGRSHEGFGDRGFGARGFGRDQERDEDDEREIKPPGRDLTP